MPHTKTTIVTAPTVEPVSLEEMRLWLRIDGNDQDTMLSELIRAARTHLEQVTWRAFCTQTWDVYWDSFDSELILPKPPIQSVTITYYDTGGTLRTLADTVYELGSRNEIGLVREKYQQTWPAVRGHRDQVIVRMICGYGVASDVPYPLRTAIKFLAAHWYVNPEPVNVGNITTNLPFTIDALISSYRLLDFAA